MTAAVLIDCCRTFGVTLAAGPDGTLAWEADDDPPAGLLAELGEHKAEVLALLTACPQCHRLMDGKRRCWRCCNRLCETCGRPTGSAFIALCLLCDIGKGA